MMLNNPATYGQSCPPLDTVLGNDTLICPDGAIYLDAGAGVSYLWSDGTTISYSIELPSILKIEIYDIMGKKIDCLFEGYKSAGDFELNYSPKPENNQAGIYYLRFELEGYTVLTKMLIQD